MLLSPNSYEGYKLLHESTHVLAKAERAGIRVDLDYCKKMQAHLTRQINRLDEQLKETNLYKVGYQTYGRTLNFGSDKHLSDILFNKMGLATDEKTNSGDPSVRAEALEALAIDVPELELLLRKRKLTKARDTYLANFITASVDGFMHPFYNISNIVTYRSSSSMPNFQNIPNRDPEIKKICRQAIIPRKGRRICSIDFSGVEVRIAACYHKDPTMLEYINDPESDMHRDMAMEIYLLSKVMWENLKRADKANDTKYAKNIRHSGKNEFVFPEFYGDWYKSCAWALWHSARKPTHILPGGIQLSTWLGENGLDSLEKFENHMKKVERAFWHDRFPVYTKWKDEWYENYQKRGYIDTLTNFRCQGVMSRNEVINYGIQGSAFHCTLASIIDIDKLLVEKKMETLMIGQIHDEDVLDLVPSEADDLLGTVKEIMTEGLRKKWPWIIVPIDVEVSLTDIDDSWYNKKEIKLAA